MNEISHFENKAYLIKRNYGPKGSGGGVYGKQSSYAKNHHNFMLLYEKW